MFILWYQPCICRSQWPSRIRKGNNWKEWRRLPSETYSSVPGTLLRPVRELTLRCISAPDAVASSPLPLPVSRLEPLRLDGVCQGNKILAPNVTRDSLIQNAEEATSSYPPRVLYHPSIKPAPFHGDAGAYQEQEKCGACPMGQFLFSATSSGAAAAAAVPV